MDEVRRSRLMRSIFGIGPAEEVAEQIALFGAPRFDNVYVERRGHAYRWSIVHRGGPYPLLRVPTVKSFQNRTQRSNC